MKDAGHLLKVVVSHRTEGWWFPFLGPFLLSVPASSAAPGVPVEEIHHQPPTETVPVLRRLLERLTLVTSSLSFGLIRTVHHLDQY